MKGDAAHSGMIEIYGLSLLYSYSVICETLLENGLNS